MNDIKTHAQVYAQAADLIEARGKAQYTYEDENGCLCALGALRIAMYGTVDVLWDECHDCLIGYCRVCDHLAELLGVVSVVLWSDRNTQDVVVAGLRRAAQQAATA